MNLKVKKNIFVGIVVIDLGEDWKNALVVVKKCCIDFLYFSLLNGVLIFSINHKINKFISNSFHKLKYQTTYPFKPITFFLIFKGII